MKNVGETEKAGLKEVRELIRDGELLRRMVKSHVAVYTVVCPQSGCVVP